jgi:plastocyanin
MEARLGTRRGSLCLAIVAAAALCAPLAPASAGLTVKPAPQPQVIVIEAMKFSPAVLNVRAGDTVVWQNKDPFPHNVVSADKQMHSPDIPAGGAWKFKVRKSGEFAYVCTLHPGMSRKLVVAPAR